MNNSNYKEYSLRVVKMRSNEASISAINNYINYINKKINTDVKFISLSNNLENKIFWYVCLQDINGKNCSVNNN